MTPLLYSELVDWYRVIDPPADHEQEAEQYRKLIEANANGSVGTLLELGAGAGHNAVHLKKHFRCTLTDISEPMQRLSRELNPECEHVNGDMRTLRLGRTFDAVLVHDAVMYMTTREDLLAAARTAFEHTRPRGVALFIPDCVRETFQESTELEGSDDGARSARFAMWTWDPDANDDTYVVDFAFLLRNGTEMQAVHDRHVEGVFSMDVWRTVLESAGFSVSTATQRGDEEGVVIFVCRRIAQP